MKNHNWYIITGGPCAGKSTTIKILKKRGYRTTEETARLYFASQIQKGLTNEQIRENPQKLQVAILHNQIALEAKYPHEQLLFLDRAIPDSYGYFMYHDLVIPKVLTNNIKDHYKGVFFLEHVPARTDRIRTESEEQMQKIEKCMYDAYEKFGFSVIRVPFMYKEKRVDFILNHIDSLTEAS